MIFLGFCIKDVDVCHIGLYEIVISTDISEKLLVLSVNKVLEVGDSTVEVHICDFCVICLKEF